MVVVARQGEHEAVPSFSSRTTRLASWPARGAELRPADWEWRHRVVCLVLAAHLPILAIWAVTADRTAELALLGLALCLLLAVAGSRMPGRVRPLAACTGLLTASMLVVHLGGGAPEANVHAFAVLALVALYQDWALSCFALLFVVVPLLLRAAGTGTSGAGESSSGWAWTGLHVVALLSETAALMLVWRTDERRRSAEEQRRRSQLSADQSSVQARLAETDRMRADLIATVSHEFRTPLTGIRGAALTLLKRGDRLDKSGRDRLLHAILDQQERLSRLLENMLVAARATETDPSASAEVDAVAAEVAMLARAGSPNAPRISVLVEAGTTAQIHRPALHQVLANLVDNALTHGASGAVPLLAGGTDEHGVWLTVSNEGSVLDLTSAGRLFEPFTQVDSGATRDREGIGVGLYVVRRLVEVHGGSVEVRSDSGWVTVHVRLRATGRSLQSSLNT